MEPVSIAIIVVVSITTGIAIYNFINGILEARKAARIVAEANKWNRTYSITKQTSSDIMKFVMWFQNHKDCANHIVEDVSNLLKASCCLPALNVPFQFGDTVMTLGRSDATYYLTVANNTKSEISKFWKNL